jgi:hypothetical protein
LEEGFEQKVAKEAKGIRVVRRVAPDSGNSLSEKKIVNA